MEKNNGTSTIFILGFIILLVFGYISFTKINNNDSNKYYSKIDDKVDAKITKMKYENGKLNINVSGSVSYICIKTTITNPNVDSICWKKFNGEISENIFPTKKYYIWFMQNNNISERYEFMVK